MRTAAKIRQNSPADHVSVASLSLAFSSAQATQLTRSPAASHRIPYVRFSELEYSLGRQFDHSACVQSNLYPSLSSGCT
jgi:hypothetical protein